MNKIFGAIIKSPLFLIRWLNAAAMRLFGSILILNCFYKLFCDIFYGNTDAEFSKTWGYLGGALISLIWGLFYVTLKPPVTKQIFLTLNKKKAVLLGRVVIIMFVFYLLADLFRENVDSLGSSIFRGLIIFMSIEYIVNTIILWRKPAAFENCQKTNKASSRNDDEIYEESEAKVDEVLRWMKGQGYVNIPKIHNPKNGKEEIRLRCNSVEQQSQEFDHIVVGENGVFNIETKYYSGSITVDKTGSWSRTDKYGNPKRDENPLMQVDRHRAVLMGILGKNTPIVDIICISHPDAILNISDNAPVPVMKYDVLSRFIQNYKSEKELSSEQIQKTVELLEQHRVISKEVQGA